MLEFFQSIPSLEASIRGSLPQVPFTVKHKNPLLPQLADLGEMYIVAVIFHRDDVIELGLCPVNCDPNNYTDYYRFDELELSGDWPPHQTAATGA